MDKFGEGKYDYVAVLVRQATKAKNALTIILDGEHGSGFTLHIEGVTREARIQNTKQMIVALAQLGKALVGGVAAMEPTPQAMEQLKIEQLRVGVKPFDLQPSPERCHHCGANLPPPDAKSDTTVS